MSYIHKNQISLLLPDEIGKFGQSALQLLGCLRIGALPSLLNSAGILSTYDDTESLLRTRAPTQLSLAAPSHNSYLAIAMHMCRMSQEKCLDGW